LSCFQTIQGFACGHDGGVSLVMSAPIRMLVSRTIRTPGGDLFVDQVEDFLLVLGGVATLDLPNGNVQDMAAYRFIDKP
jgi:hypothetical protein